ncbi:hypothetical protein BB8028_0002g05260 [Beauveria bassiana]|uniref:Methyltransferase type 11 domain-containing protein n=1 Tax=Beauveria bassiana TaxID=176275 RepID=A0A2S7Y2V9_BEABA|nr:hypothetical protein BB8028_0002g05260 [Beauveria bassiana]
MCAMAPEQANEQLIANITTRLSTYISLRHAWRDPAKLYIASLWSNLRSGNFGVLVSPSSVGDKTFAKWWLATSHNFMGHEEAFGAPALVGSAHGVVLDLGAGSGNQLHRLDTNRLTQVYGIESNAAFVPALTNKIHELHLEKLYTPVVARIEDAKEELAKLGVQPGTVDCILSIQVLCSIPNLKSVIKDLHYLLKPGGELIFWEHQQNEVDWITRAVQGLWNIFWTPVVGSCRLNQPIRKTLLATADWKIIEIRVDEDPLGLMPRVSGRLQKKAHA